MLAQLTTALLPALTTRSRATLLACLALAHGEDTAGAPAALPSAFAAAALRLLLGTRGLELTRLKEAVNTAHPSLDLHQLVYARLAHAPSRSELLQHLAVEGAAVLAARGGAPLACQVVSDFDDTLRQGWRDARFPRHAPYPGAAALLAELQAAGARAAACPGLAPPGWWQGGGLPRLIVPGARPHGSTLPRRLAARALVGLAPARSAVAAMRGLPAQSAQPGLPELMAAVLRALGAAGGDWAGAAPAPPAPPAAPPLPGTLVVLTARPSGPRGIVRRHTLQALAPPGIPHVTLLMGSLLRSASTQGIAELKLDNFSTWRALWPEYAWVLLGDCGQGDAAMGAAALARYGSSSSGSGSGSGVGGGIAAVLIHNVTPSEGMCGDGGSKAGYAERGVHFFHSYAGAALGAAARGLLPQDALWRVCSAVAAELQALDFGGLRAGGREAKERALACTLRDLQAAQWPGCAALGEEWARAEARVAAAERAEEGARAAGLGAAAGGEASQQQAVPSVKDVQFAAWSGT